MKHLYKVRTFRHYEFCFHDIPHTKKYLKDFKEYPLVSNLAHEHHSIDNKKQDINHIVDTFYRQYKSSIIFLNLFCLKETYEANL